MTPPAGARRDLLEVIEAQRLGCELAGSPLYAAVLDAVAADVARQGPIAGLLAPLADAPFGDAVLLRLLAGLHALVLEGEAPELAAHYPSVGGAPGPTLAVAVHRTVAAHRAELAAHLEEGVQTNEVGRSATLLGGYLEVARHGLPLRVLELGASAGLNLLFDRYRYLDRERSFGPVDSPLAFDRPWFGGGPDLDLPLEVVERSGCDLAPIDPTTPAGRLRLRSFVWADQPERLARLDAALEVARAHPPTVEQADATVWLADRLRDPRPGCVTVVSHAIVFQYLSAEGRKDLLAVLDGAAARATDEAPLAWLRLEPGGDQAELRLTTWPGGTTRLLATSAYHGPPVAWRGPSG